MVELKKASLMDFKEISEIEETIFSTPWTHNALLETYATGLFEIEIAKIGDEIVAYAGIYSVLDDAFIANIATKEGFRGRGFGRMVTEKAIANAKNRDCRTLSLEVRKSNSVAISLYESLGFLNMGVRKGFYKKPTEDALIMTLTL